KIPVKRKTPVKKKAEKLIAAEPQHNSESLSLFSEFDIQLFRAGKLYHLYNKMGSQAVEHQGVKGTYFALWAPNARTVHEIRKVYCCDRQSHSTAARWDGSGIWRAFIPHLGKGEYYKYFVESHNGHTAEKGDPYAFHWESSPHTASVVWPPDFK